MIPAFSTVFTRFSTDTTDWQRVGSCYVFCFASPPKKQETERKKKQKTKKQDTQNQKTIKQMYAPRGSSGRELVLSRFCFV